MSNKEIKQQSRVYIEDDEYDPNDIDGLVQVFSQVDDANDVLINEEKGPNSVQVFETSKRTEQQKEEEAKLKVNGKRLITAANSTMNVSAENEEELRRLVRHITTPPAYGRPVDEQLAEHLTEELSGGLIYHAKIYRTGFFHPSVCIKTPGGKREHELKKKRPVPIVYEEDFFNSLTQVDGAWIFQGKLNGWPGLKNLELISLDYWYSKKVGPKTVALSKNIWNLNSSDAPKYPTPGYIFFTGKPGSIRAKLRAPSYTDLGYDKGNKGFCWWYRGAEDATPVADKFIYGEKSIETIRKEAEESGKPVMKAVKAHFYGHRYVKKRETPKDMFVYHTGVVLEWDHGKYCTNVELAYLYGITGFSGRSNWLADTFAKPHPKMLESIPGNLQCPWNNARSEIRMTDMKVKNLEEFEQFLRSNQDRKFLNPSIKYTNDVRLSMCSADSIVRYLINYNLRDRSYSEEYHNCQNFAADFFSFMCSKTDVDPFYPVRLLHKERRHHFLYEPHHFPKAEKKIKKTVQQIRTKVKKPKNKVLEQKKSEQGLFSYLALQLFEQPFEIRVVSFSSSLRTFVFLQIAFDVAFQS
eukprot:snap_masked-scaffold_4-processed-gene-7.36-mRNA-1 protein AED:1.00 eAED:1.00 QI:0/0/0/0/1/1/2/0/580